MSEDYFPDTQPPNPRPLAGEFFISVWINLSNQHKYFSNFSMVCAAEMLNETCSFFLLLCVGVIAYVDVRSGKGRCENRSKAVAKQLDNLGATVSPKYYVLFT